MNLYTTEALHDSIILFNYSSTFWTKGKSNLMMLNADMAMYKNYTLSGYFDTPSCDIINHTSCEPSSAAKYVSMKLH